MSGLIMFRGNYNNIESVMGLRALAPQHYTSQSEFENAIEKDLWRTPCATLNESRISMVERLRERKNSYIQGRDDTYGQDHTCASKFIFYVQNTVLDSMNYDSQNFREVMDNNSNIRFVYVNQDQVLCGCCITIKWDPKTIDNKNDGQRKYQYAITIAENVNGSANTRPTTVIIDEDIHIQLLFPKRPKDKNYTVTPKPEDLQCGESVSKTDLLHSIKNAVKSDDIMVLLTPVFADGRFDIQEFRKLEDRLSRGNMLDDRDAKTERLNLKSTLIKGLISNDDPLNSILKRFSEDSNTDINFFKDDVFERNMNQLDDGIKSIQSRDKLTKMIDKLLEKNQTTSLLYDSLEKAKVYLVGNENLSQSRLEEVIDDIQTAEIFAYNSLKTRNRGIHNDAEEKIRNLVEPSMPTQPNNFDKDIISRNRTKFNFLVSSITVTIVAGLMSLYFGVSIAFSAIALTALSPMILPLLIGSLVVSGLFGLISGITHWFIHREDKSQQNINSTYQNEFNKYIEDKIKYESNISRIRSDENKKSREDMSDKFKVDKVIFGLRSLLPLLENIPCTVTGDSTSESSQRSRSSSPTSTLATLEGVISDSAAGVGRP